MYKTLYEDGVVVKGGQRGGSTTEGGVIGNGTPLINVSPLQPEINLSWLEAFDDVSYYPDFTQNEYVRAVFICLFSLECVAGVVGNILVVMTVFRNRSMHSNVNYYLVNLGLCDFLITAFVLPVKLFELVADAEMNMLTDFWCTAVRYSETILVFVSVFTLVAISFERYSAVVNPVHCPLNPSRWRVRRVLIAIWVLLANVSLPSLYPAQSISHYLFSDYGAMSRVTCADRFSKTFRLFYFLFLFLFVYIGPMCVVSMTCGYIVIVLHRGLPPSSGRYADQQRIQTARRMVAKMIMVVVMTFFLTWTPYFLVSVLTQLQSKNFLQNGQFFFTMLCINFLAFLNSCVNPFIYFAMSDKYRKGISDLVKNWKQSVCKRGWGRSRNGLNDSPEFNRDAGNMINLEGLPGFHVVLEDILDEDENVCSESQRKGPPCHASSNQEKGSPSRSNQRKGSPASSNKEKGSPTSSNQRKGSPASSNQRKGSPASSNQENRSPASSNQENGSPASSNQRKGSPTSSNQENGSPASSNHT